MRKVIRVSDPRHAADQVALLVIDQPARMVRVEGRSLAGKTGLSGHLARVLGGIHVDTDVYLSEGADHPAQLIENVARYVASGLYVILEGIRLEERCPSAGPAFRVLVTADYEDPRDAIRPAEINAELEVDRYLEHFHPADHTDVEVIVRHASEHAAMIAAIEKMNAGN